jgi:hypothetical protein
MAMLGNALLFAILTAAFLVHPVPAAADETQSMVNSAPNADATLRDRTETPAHRSREAIRE